MTAALSSRRSGLTAIVCGVTWILAACGSAPAATGPSASAAPLVTPATSATAVPTAPPITTTVPTPTAPAGWVLYTSTSNHLTFMHPPTPAPVDCGDAALIDPAAPTSCPQGDGQCCIVIGQSDGSNGLAVSLISDHPALYSNIKRTSVTIDGVVGTRITAVQTEGQGGGPQLEYDFTFDGRKYFVLADVSGTGALEPGTPSTALVDEIVSTMTFTA